MRKQVVEIFLAVAIILVAASRAMAAQEEEAPAPGWLERDTLTGDWGGIRPWLKERGITLKPRLTRFYQGMGSGDGDHDFEYGGKADLLFNAALSRDLKDSLEILVDIRDEQGIEVFYNFSVTPWLNVGADLQIIKPSLENDTAVFSGLRTVIRF